MAGSKKHFGKYQSRIGTRAQVYHGTSLKTSGGLIKSDLIKNKSGRIVSKAKHFTAKKEKRLLKFGYGTKKGSFGFVRLGSKGKKSKRGGSKFAQNVLHKAATMKHHIGGRRRGRGRSYRGGLHALSPMEVSGIEKTSGADIQLMATNY
jgi:hypothetical protein